MRGPRTTIEAQRTPWIVTPAVLVVLGYGVILRIVSLQFLCTLRFPNPDEIEAWNAMWRPVGAALTALNAGLATFIVVEWAAGRGRASVSVRRGRVAGYLLALFYLGCVQWLVTVAPGWMPF